MVFVNAFKPVVDEVVRVIFFIVSEETIHCTNLVVNTVTRSGLLERHCKIEAYLYRILTIKGDSNLRKQVYMYRKGFNANT
ncbi:uncharacterized protein OCT59_015913 [Rhizophagus irregularis]|uniref:uncharacterized protein n=1 Tax=Rhizophagus irregularis TaxID=588596 RepID=UPI0033197E23|nr:hypothetical protein OCT59_015913 [Rhizophagus irregularis]